MGLYEKLKAWADVRVGTVTDYQEAFSVAIDKADRDQDGMISRGEMLAVFGKTFLEIRRRKK